MSYDGPTNPRGSKPDPRRLAFEAALRRHEGNITRTARSLGVSRMTGQRWAKMLREGTLLRRFPEHVR